ncbi:MAG: ABC transporter ATP-binding protein [Burkholderiales bacterium]|nr:ABC transporter ATP-binding protein [Bacteroidia bacterium]
MKPILEVQNISKKFMINHEQQAYLSLRDSISNIFKSRNSTEEFFALKDVSFEVMPGDTVGIIGKNGAGKSTLLKILSKITPPSTGRIIGRGRVASLLEVGTGFHPELSGRENIFMNGSILGMRRTEILRNFDAIVDFADVEKFIDTPLKHYSSGMQLRLAFAVAAFLENEILIIDEVLAVGDAEFQKKCMGKMGDISNSGRTILFVSHNMVGVKSLCSKGVLIEKGVVKQTGKIDEIINLYLSKVSGSENYFATDLNLAIGNDFLKLTRITTIYDSHDGHIYINTPIKIEFELEYLLEKPLVFNLSIVLNTINQILVFNVSTEAKTVNKGKITCCLEIPANLLNDEIYIMDVYLVKDSSVVLVKNESTIQIEVKDLPRDGNWYGKWLGVVRPQLNFSLKN